MGIGRLIINFDEFYIGLARIFRQDLGTVSMEHEWARINQRPKIMSQKGLSGVVLEWHHRTHQLSYQDVLRDSAGYKQGASTATNTVPEMNNMGPD